MPPAIRVEGLSKLYRIGTRKQAYHTLRETLSEAGQAAWRNACRAAARAATAWRANGRSPAAHAATGVSPNGATQGTDGAEGRLDTTPRLEGDHFWALKDVSFEVQPGEVVGIIGRNGAGKSTLLKILSRITEPTAGRVELRGRVGSLLEVGTGFHPELTGRENIYLNGSILGMSRREIQRKFDEIVAFAEIEDFLDTPVKRYSSGMYVRLAFAVAAHLEPEILIVDEVLAVGDAAFQQKCLGKMQNVASHGRTVLFVSHNMAAVESLCRTAIELADGQLRAHGSATTVTSQYRAKVSIKCSPDDANTYRVCRYIRRISLIDDDGNPVSSIRLGGKFRLRIDLDCDTDSTISTIGIGIDDLFGQRMLTLFPPKHFLIRVTTPRKCTVYCYVEHFPLRPGLYTIKCALSHLGDELDSITGVCPFGVIDADFCDQGRGFHAGVCVAKSTWNFD